MLNFVILYIIIYYAKPGIRWPALAPLRLELLVGLIILVALFLKHGKKLFARDSMNKAIAIFFSAICLSFLGALWTHTGTDAFRILIEVLKNFALYLMIIGTVDSEKKLKKLIFCYLAVIIFHYLEPLYLLKFGGWVSHRRGALTHLEGFGFFGQYNQLAGITLINLAFVIYLFLYHRNVLLKLVYFVCAMLGLWVIVLTGSRTSYVGSVFFVFFFIAASRRKFLITMISVAAVCIVFVMMPTEYKDRLYSLGKTSDVLAGEKVDDSIYTRWVILEDAWDIFLDYPVVGCGLDSFRIIRHSRFHRIQQTHNLYLQLLTNMGIVGFFAFFYLMYVIYHLMRITRVRLLRVGASRHYYYYIMQAVFVYLSTKLVISFFGHGLYSNYWWLAAALVKTVHNLSSGVQGNQSCNGLVFRDQKK